MTLDLVFIIAGAICVVTGIIGCLLPVLPGPPVSYAGLILLQLSSYHPFSTTFLIVYALLTIVIAVLDYVIPVYGTKKMQGSKYGTWGSAVGLLIGIIFLFPFGILIGPMIGAFTGELISGKTIRAAIRSASGSFFGFLAGAAIKLMLVISIAYYYGITLYSIYFTN